jgi:molybdate transport system substrate-binding protein
MWLDCANSQVEVMMRSLWLAAAIGAIIVMAQGGTGKAAEIKVMTGNALRAAYDELLPQFERATGHKLALQLGLPPALFQKIDAGEPFDVVILSLDVEGLIKQGKVAANSRTVLGRTGVGVAIQKGAPKPDFSTVEAFKRMLLNAKTFATSGDGSSGRYVAGLLERLGIADQVKSKMRSGLSGAAGEMLSRGEVELVVSGLPPLIGVPNIEWLGPIPAEINSWVVFTGGVSTTAKEAEAGRALLKFLTTPAAVAVLKAKGLDPVP